MERLWLLVIYPKANLRSAVEWLNGAQQLTINAILLQNLLKFVPRNSVICFFKIDKACKEIFAILPRFLEDLLQRENLVRGAATRTKTALTIFQFWFHYFSAFPFNAFGIYFPWQTEEWYPSVVCTLLAISFFEYQNRHTCLPNFHATWHTRVNHRISSPSVSAFNISGLISSSPAAFPDFIPLITVATSAAVKTSSSLNVSRVDAFTGLKRSSKYSLHRERISFSSVRMLPAESLMEYVTLHLLPRKRRMVCQNTLFAEK